MAVHQDLILHIATDHFFIEPLANSTQILVIDRVTQEVSLKTNAEQIPVDAVRKSICAVVGIIRLLAGPYLIVITKKARIGDINGNPIWRVVETEVISYSRSLLHLTDQQIQDNKIYVSMIEFMLSAEHYYFSCTYDLTHTMQRLYNTTPEFLHISLHERADQRFVWNGHLMRDWAQQPELSQFCVPIILGYISIRTCTVNRKTFTWTLISRRSCFRAGTRFFMRGLDSEGHAANYVETEQIVEYNNNSCSFVQIRGSIPLYWSQKPDLRYMPQPQISNAHDHVDGYSKHFDTQIVNYGKQVIVNLINQKGRELKLEQALSDVISTANNPYVKYVPFDFHHECRHMQWHRLHLLIDKIAHDQDDFGYFLLLQDGSSPLQQDGVFRTNCMDCLDRTNVVQSLLAKRSLQAQLTRLGVLQEGQPIDDQTTFQAIYKNVWADNADVCSVQYAGTGALKTDFTRTGKRTHSGAMRDGVNSLVRYYKNNFRDGFRQDAIDLFLGNYVVEENEGVLKSCPLNEKKDWKYLTLPIISLLALAMCFFHVLIPAEYSTETLLSLLFWFAMVVTSVSFIFRYGPEYVDQPRLCEVNKKKD